VARRDLESARSIFQVTFMATAYIIPFELLGLGLADSKVFPSDWVLLFFAVMSGFSMLWSAPLGTLISNRLHY